MVVWEFRVKAGREAEFIQAYGPEGVWAALFRRSPEFRGVELARSVGQPDRFYTFDHWLSAAAFREFLMANAGAYEEQDTKLAGLTEWERRIGAFPQEEPAEQNARRGSRDGEGEV